MIINIPPLQHEAIVKKFISLRFAVLFIFLAGCTSLQYTEDHAAEYIDRIVSATAAIDKDDFSVDLLNFPIITGSEAGLQLDLIFRIITVIFFILVLIIIFQMHKAWKKNEENNRLLKQLHSQISEQNTYMQHIMNALEESESENLRVTKIIAHDLRSPIGAIVSASSLLLNETKLNEEASELISIIQKAGINALTFMTAILEKEDAHAVLKKEPVELNTLIKYCANILKYKAIEKRQTITIDSQTILLDCNLENIWRVISNLLTNAIKFSPDHSTIVLQTTEFDEHVIIEVKDQGIGIPNDLKPSLFTSQERRKRIGTRGEKPYGMGLPIAKKIIDAHKGKIWFEENEFKGTTFFVQLPK